MSWRTTLVLVALTVAGAGVWWVGPRLPSWLNPSPSTPPQTDAGTIAVFSDKLEPENLRLIQISDRQGRVLVKLTRDQGHWSLPGGWPVRTREVDDLVRRLGSLHSRFDPFPLSEDEKERQKALKETFGLEPPAYTVLIKAGPTEYRIAFGEGKEESNRFFRPTYARLDERPEVIRLGAGLLPLLGRNQDYYQKRRLFSVERVARDGGFGGARRVEQLAASQVEVKPEKGQGFTLVHTDARGWHLTAPYLDRADPSARDSLLEAGGDLWAERFVQTDPDDPTTAGSASKIPGLGVPGPLGLAARTQKWIDFWTGLDHPQQTLTITDRDGSRTLLIGNISSKKESRSAPAAPGLPPPPGDVFRYAQIKGNEQLFEIKANRLDNIFVGLDRIRETKVADFKPEDVQRVEIHRGKDVLVLARNDKKEWHLEKPGAEPGKKETSPADKDKVEELVRQISFLNGEEKPSDRVALAGTLLGLTTPPFQPGLGVALAAIPGRFLVGDQFPDRPLAEVTLILAEEKTRPDGSKETKTRELTLKVGGHDKLHKQLFVKLGDWPRVSVVDDSLWPLLTRPALAYKGKLFDFDVAQIKNITLDQPGKKIALVQTGGKWQLTEPAKATADAGKVGQLADTLKKLEPVAFVGTETSPEVLEKQYGLGKSGLGVTVSSGDRSRTLRVGKKREGGDDYFARLEDSPNVFAVSEEARSVVARDSLSYLPLELWQVDRDRIESIKVEKKGTEPYTLGREGETGWKLTAPVATAASADAVKALVDVLAAPHVDHYVAHRADDPKTYGLDAPSLKLEVDVKGGPKRVLLVGGQVKDTKDRYARLSDGEAVGVLRADVVEKLDRTAASMADPLLLQLDLDGIRRIEASRGKDRLVLEPKEKTWMVTEAPGAPFPADENAVDALRPVLANLKAESLVDLGNKIDPKQYGLDAPFAVVNVSSEKEGKKTEHKLELGAEVKGKSGQRYARLDGKPVVAVLTEDQTRAFSRAYLDYVNHRLLSLDQEKVTGVSRNKGEESLELARKDGAWKLVKPQAYPAEGPAVDTLVEQLCGLRVANVADYPLKDPKKYGLDVPFAVLTLDLGGKEAHKVTLGAEVPGRKGERYCRVDDSAVVGVLPAPLVGRLSAGPLAFRYRSIAHFEKADRILLERDRRKATLSKEGGTWSMTQPVKAPLLSDQVAAFVKKVSSLKADELVAEKPADLKPYGLDRPQIRWRFQDGDRTVLDLLVGKAGPLGRRRYAKLPGGDMVFLLDLEASTWVLAEYREPAVWETPVDAAAVASLKVIHGNKTLVLKRQGTGWEAEGVAGAKPYPETVNDTVAALAGLKLHRYAVDKGADLKLFGLDPPQVVIEAATGQRKVTLELGHFEEGSRRRYARVGEKGRTDVMILGEKDSRRLSRDLAAFEKPLPKGPGPLPSIKGKPLPGHP
jgi:Domain of unknown function (DUF4340)